MINRNFIFALLLAIVSASCNTDLKKEQKAYDDAINSYPVLAYRGTKMMVRASSSIVIDTNKTFDEATFKEMFVIDKDSIGTALEFQKFVDHLLEEIKDTSNNKPVEIDWMKFGKEMYSLKGKIEDTDEDEYPMFIQMAPDTVQKPLRDYFTQHGLQYNNSTEHMFFGLVGTASFSSPKEINLYELSRVKKEEIGTNELWILKCFLEILNMSLCDWHHLAELRCTELIEENEKHPCSASLISQHSQNGISPEAGQKSIQAMCYGFRAFERYKLSKEDSDKKKEALEDVMKAVELTNEAGLNIPELNLLVAGIAAINKDFDKTKNYCQLVVDHPNADPKSKEYAQHIINLINEGNEDEAGEEMEDKLNESVFIFNAIKDFAGLSLDIEGYAEKMMEETKENPVEQCFAFLKIYTIETKDWDLYLQVSKLEMKWHQLVD